MTMDQVFYGTPRPLPRVLVCNATPKFCGRVWTANTPEQYEERVKARQAHQVLCEASTLDHEEVKRLAERRFAPNLPRIRLDGFR